MAARCASCSYALSVSDSVSCCECKSYFHIDCAQLVGFPYYELSSDPVRNTFHCQTCKILPLPRQADFSDSDSDDYAMPSRQVEYHLEGHSDFAADMNEVKGSVQDLSDLCKEMFREISELKSINLTLRCCVENLKLDGEQRDRAIADLKRRLDALEGNQTVGVFKAIDTTDVYIDVMRNEKEEEPERFLTPDPELSKAKEVEALEEGRYHDEEISQADMVINKINNNLAFESTETENISEEITSQKQEIYQDEVETSNIVTTHTEEESQENSKEIMHYAEEETIPDSVEEDYCEGGGDWSWRGHEAIQLTEGTENTYEKDEGNDLRAEECSVVLMENISGEDDDNYEPRDIEGTEQDWEILEEEASAEISSGRNERKTSEIKISTEERDVGSDGERVTWADEEEEAVEKTEAASEGGERISLKSEEEEEKSKLEEDLGIVEEGAEAEGRTESPRVEGGGDPVVERGEVPEGELEGGQSPDLREVQPSELPESSEPQPPPQPQHTPDDLWDYLKETVSGEHPSTVEEFVQKLIGTLEHVPEEYLKPVIDYNIKRATSPSVTDGEHLESKEGDQQLQGEEHVTESGETQDGTVLGDPTATGAEGAPSVIEDPVEDSANLHEDFPEDRPDSAAGYSALEAAS